MFLGLFNYAVRTKEFKWRLLFEQFWGISRKEFAGKRPWAFQIQYQRFTAFAEESRQDAQSS